MSFLLCCRFTYSVFYNIISSSDYILLNSGMISERQIGKDMEGSGYEGVLKVLIPQFRWRDCR
jgi:hypothetical protein